MSTYHERRNREQRKHKWQSRRRRLKQARLVSVVLGGLCLVIGLILVIISFFISEQNAHRWLMFGGAYVGGGVGFFVLRLSLFGYEKLLRSIERGKSRA